MTGWLMGGALFGKLLGFLREIALGRALGASYVADAYRGALTAVALPISPFVGDIIPAVLVPLHRQWSGEGRSIRLFNSLLAAFFLAGVILASTIWYFASAWLSFLVPGFGNDAHRLTVRFVRVMSLMMPAWVLCAGLISVELSRGRPRVTSLRAPVLNCAVIVGISIMVATGQVLAIAWSMVIGFNAISAYGGLMLWYDGEINLSSISVASTVEALREVGRRVKPLLVQPVFEQGNSILERIVASAAGVGLIASLEYARTLSDILLFIVAQPIGYVVLAAGKAAEARVAVIAQMVLGLAVPASIYFVVFAPDLISVVFQRGNFDAHAVTLTSQALRGIALGLWAATLGNILVRILNATVRNGAAVAVLAVSFVANMLVNVVAVPVLGAFGLGLGEGMRGLVILAGSMVVMRNVRILAPILIEQCVVALAVTGLCVAVKLYVDALLVRIAIGASVACLAMVAWYFIRVSELLLVYRSADGHNDQS
jgi:putative peptidoglycan lipid II flippase